MFRSRPFPIFRGRNGSVVARLVGDYGELMSPAGLARPLEAAAMKRASPERNLRQYVPLRWVVPDVAEIHGEAGGAAPNPKLGHAAHNT